MIDLDKPHVSIIMPAYNAESTIEKSIKSVQAQTIDSWELLVLDDCSSDKTRDIVIKFAQQDARISLVSNKKNSGVAKTRNLGLGMCKGEYIAFLDSDDQWRPEKLECQLACFERNNVDIVYTSYAIVDDSGKKWCKDFLVPEQVVLKDLLKENVIGCSTVMITKQIGKNHRFKEDFYHEDYVLWLQLLRLGYKAVGIKQVMVDYFFHKDSKAGNKCNAAKERWKIYRKYLRFSLIKSVWYFANYAMAGVRKYRRL